MRVSLKSVQKQANTNFQKTRLFVYMHYYSSRYFLLRKKDAFSMPLTVVYEGIVQMHRAWIIDGSKFISELLYGARCSWWAYTITWMRFNKLSHMKNKLFSNLYVQYHIGYSLKERSLSWIRSLLVNKTPLKKKT